MATAFTYKSYLLHDRDCHKKIQPAGKENRLEVGLFSLGKFTSYLCWYKGSCVVRAGAEIAMTATLDYAVRPLSTPEWNYYATTIEN